PLCAVTISLHDALPISRITDRGMQLLKSAPAIVELKLYYAEQVTDEGMSAVKGWKHLKRVNLRGTKVTDTTQVDALQMLPALHRDRKSTRLNSSHLGIS